MDGGVLDPRYLCLQVGCVGRAVPSQVGLPASRGELTEVGGVPVTVQLRCIQQCPDV